jgi:hypothetical protein
MSRQSHSRDDLSKIGKGRPDRHGKLIVGKRGVYMIRGDHRLKNIQLISWEQLLESAANSN